MLKRFNKMQRLCLAGLIAGQLLFTAQAAHSDLVQDITNLRGYWAGRAIETPVGPRDYHILFHACEGGTIAGVASTGASLHYWQFLPHEEALKIRFLSTFRGNRKPTYLQAIRNEENVLELQAPELELLSLKITFLDDETDIRIFHYQKPHVHIRLSRSDPSPSPEAPYHSKLNSCRGVPAD